MKVALFSEELTFKTEFSSSLKTHLHYQSLQSSRFVSGILGDLLLAIIFAFQIFFINSIASTIALGHIPVISDVDPVIVFFLDPCS